MKLKDLIFFALLIGLFLPFFFSETIFKFYENFNKEHLVITSFVKFSILATIGECIGLRIKAGEYNQPGFGVLPRAIVWGFLGMAIQLAFVVFSTGTPVFLTKTIGISWAADFIDKDKILALSWTKRILVAFSISAAMNLIFAPVMMTFHKITDTHIINNGGTISGFFRPIKFREIFKTLNWEVQWNFVFKKTIPFFWIPAHTITFLLPSEYRVLFAALLGIALGILLAVASQSGKK
jgi:hypothetical protein